MTEAQIWERLDEIVTTQAANSAALTHLEKMLIDAANDRRTANAALADIDRRVTRLEAKQVSPESFHATEIEAAITKAIRNERERIGDNARGRWSLIVAIASMIGGTAGVVVSIVVASVG